MADESNLPTNVDDLPEPQEIQGIIIAMKGGKRCLYFATPTGLQGFSMDNTAVAFNLSYLLFGVALQRIRDTAQEENQKTDTEMGKEINKFMDGLDLTGI